MIRAGEILHGSDEDVVVNMYLAVLGRWPDEPGFEQHMQFIAGRPEAREEALTSMRNSEEARLRNLPLDPDATPVPAEQALAAQLRLRTEWFRRELGALRAAPAEGGAAAALEELTALRRELAELRRESEARLARLETTPAAALAAVPALSPALSIGYVNDLLETLRGELLQRIRTVEIRVVEAGARGPG